MQVLVSWHMFYAVLETRCSGFTSCLIIGPRSWAFCTARMQNRGTPYSLLGRGLQPSPVLTVPPPPGACSEAADVGAEVGYSSTVAEKVQFLLTIGFLLGQIFISKSCVKM